MTSKEINSRLRSILNKLDVDKDHPISRQKSKKHGSDTEVLLEHVSLLVQDILFDSECLRRELMDVIGLLESDNDF